MTESLTITVWGRLFTLPIIYDCYGNETVTDEQIDVLKTFTSHLEWLEKSKKQVEAYCRKCVIDDDSNKKKNNIFSYVMPRSIFVMRDKKQPRIALMCRYKYDPEHDIAIVFSSDGQTTVCPQDIIL